MDAASKATIALQKAQASQIYAGLNLWPTETTARLVEAQLAEDGTYPGAEGIFAGAGSGTAAQKEAKAIEKGAEGTTDVFPVPSGSPAYLAQPRDPEGRWVAGGGSAALPIIPAMSRKEEEEQETGERHYGTDEEEAPPLNITPRFGTHGPLSTIPFPTPPIPAERIPSRGPLAVPVSPLAKAGARLRSNSWRPTRLDPRGRGEKLLFHDHPCNQRHASMKKVLNEEDAITRPFLVEYNREAPAPEFTPDLIR